MNKLLNFILSVLGLLLIIVAIFVIGLTVFTNIIPEHSLIYVLDIPEIAVVTGIVFSSFLFLLLPGLILIAFTRIINLLEEITNL
ncbi:hypothetical protein I0Q91_02755 [Halanaerobiaceae bacterium Z-7014]|uniref:Uncharacterized protein n=1 Tax=Halonatronomonas betaini TaxID=2778430 RepID=A0A931F928_9FIRM|nr:hypothetical protein [Halonatronomonas betaini]MBF8435989.1 hypothetical protein [Halonatronomonas betaini]